MTVGVKKCCSLPRTSRNKADVTAVSFAVPGTGTFLGTMQSLSSSYFCVNLSLYTLETSICAIMRSFVRSPGLVPLKVWWLAQNLGVLSGYFDGNEKPVRAVQVGFWLRKPLATYILINFRVLT